eukprot:c14813_g1_i2 orf=337-2022(+)
MASTGRANEMVPGFYLQAVRLARRVRLRDIWGGGIDAEDGGGPSTAVTRNEQGHLDSEGSTDEDFDPNDDSDCEREQDLCAEERDTIDGIGPQRARTRTRSETIKNTAPLDHDIAHLTKRSIFPSESYSKCGRVDKDGVVSTLAMLSGRESNISKMGRWSRADCCHMAARYLPVDNPNIIDSMNSRVYVGRFSADGSLFVGGFQERHIRIYNVDQRWNIKKDILARQLRWTVTDTALSHDQRFLIYATISPIVHLVNVGNETGVASLANITDIHEGLDFSMEPSGQYSLGLYSVQFSQDGREIVAGSNKNSIYVYDLEANKPVLCLQAHKDDVNTVTYADETCNLIFSGSDDNTCKVWDRRCLMSKSRPAGMLVGHLEGITFIDSRGDGRYFISNGKDQTIKLWDIRKMSTTTSASKSKGKRIPSFSWDYRWMDYPGGVKDIKHPYDQSLMTYKGHQVLRTLIRCYFSPVFTTGQKYIYTGSHDGLVYIYDIVTGRCVAKLNYHRSTVRDCSWHPFYPKLVSSSWDGKIVEWENLHGDSTGERRIPRQLVPIVHMDMYDSD